MADIDATTGSSLSIEAQLGPKLAAQFRALADGRGDDRLFRAAAFEYFDRCLTDRMNPDPYFDWVNSLAMPTSSTPVGFTGLWEAAMNVAHEWEDSRTRHQHKGSGYYFAGMRDAALGSLDRAFLYAHQAAVEDAWPVRDRIPPSPAGWFITLDDRSLNQSAYEMVHRWAAFLEDRLAEYRRAGRGNLSIDGLRARYEGTASLGETMTAVAHTVARLVYLAPTRVFRIHENRFAALLLTQVELELCFILEDVLTDAPGIVDPGWTLSKLIGQYPAGHGVHLDPKMDIKVISDLVNAGGNFAVVLGELLQSRTVTGFHRVLEDRETDLLVALLIRNTSAHGLDRPGNIAVTFDQVVQRLFFALFAAIESLYAG